MPTDTVHLKPPSDPSAPSTASAPSRSPRPPRGRHPQLRRWTRWVTGVAIFLAGLLSAEAFQAVAEVLEPAPVQVAAQPGPATSSFLANTAIAREAARDEAAREATAKAAVSAVHDLLVAIAPEGLTLERRRMWRVLADCESGNWSRGVPVPGSRDWDATKGFFEGGLQFHPRTWDAFRDPDMPASANEALPVTQMVVAERVLEVQGWRAWPVCSRKVGYR